MRKKLPLLLFSLPALLPLFLFVLYYGSFLEVAGEGFDWEAEVWETLLHELRHHLESLAGRDDLVREDLRRLDAFRRGGPSGEG